MDMGACRHCCPTAQPDRGCTPRRSTRHDPMRHTKGTAMRKFALAVLLLTALAAPLGLAASVSAAPDAEAARTRPVKLRLIELKCVDPEDFWGEDQAYLQRNGSTIWGPELMEASDSVSLRSVPLIPFRQSITLELWEEDGEWGDPH